jgi:hypothetical protein
MILLAIVSFLYVLCEGVESQPCQPCVNGDAVIVPEDDDGTCADLIFYPKTTLAANTRECSASHLMNYQSFCCGEAPSGLCTICPDGAFFKANTVVPNFDPEGNDLTCADINADDSFLDFLFEAGSCDDTLLQRSAAWCGCPGVSRECSLCPDGSRPPQQERVDKVYYGWNCAAFDFVSTYFKSDECVNLAESVFEFDAASFCGCPDSPKPDICEFCPDGQELINAGIELGSGAFTCEDIHLSTGFIPSIDPCVRVLTSYRELGYVDQCCGVPGKSSGAGWSLYKVIAAAIVLSVASLHLLW